MLMKMNVFPMSETRICFKYLCHNGQYTEFNFPLGDVFLYLSINCRHLQGGLRYLAPGFFRARHKEMSVIEIIQNSWPCVKSGHARPQSDPFYCPCQTATPQPIKLLLPSAPPSREIQQNYLKNNLRINV